MIWLWTLTACGDFVRDTADTGSDCTDPATCFVTVSELTYECGDSGLTGTRVLSATPSSPGTVMVNHADFREGCCPDFTATANANRGEARIDVSYSLTDDACDCVCLLDLTYTLSGIQAGEWSLAAGFDLTVVTVE